MNGEKYAVTVSEPVCTTDQANDTTTMSPSTGTATSRIGRWARTTSTHSSRTSSGQTR